MCAVKSLQVLAEAAPQHNGPSSLAFAFLLLRLAFHWTRFLCRFNCKARPTKFASARLGGDVLKVGRKERVAQLALLSFVTACLG